MCNDQLEAAVRNLLTRALEPETPLAEVSADAPLFEGEFGLDSVDLVSAIVAVERHFELTFDPGLDMAVAFRTIASISATISEQRSDAVGVVGAARAAAAAGGGR
jgi:acyl carrier protein